MLSENLPVAKIIENNDEEPEVATKKKTKKSNVDKITNKEIKLISMTISDLAEEDGWAFLGDVGSLLLKKQPNFDSRNFGFQKLTPLIKSINKFEIEHRENASGRRQLIYVKIKESNRNKRK